MVKKGLSHEERNLILKLISKAIKDDLIGIRVDVGIALSNLERQ